MAPQTALIPTPTLPAVITAPPTVQFTPGPGCVDPDDHWVVVTSCYAYALNADPSQYSSPDWLTCQVTQFGPAQNGPASCFVPYSAQTVVDEETRFYTDCPVGYSGADTRTYSRSDGLESDFHVYCCPTQYNFNVRDYFTGDGGGFVSERDGISFSAEYPIPGCAASYITELSGKEIAVQTQINTDAWEKRQVQNVPWDYERDTMFAEMQDFSYTVFLGTHTCYQDCYGWNSYYFSGGPEPPFTAIDTVPATTTPVEEPTTTAPTSSESEVEIAPVETPPVEETSLVEETPPVEETSSIEETSELSATPTSTQAISSPNGEDSPPTSSPIETTPTSTPSENDGTVTSSFASPPSSTTSSVPEGAAAVVTPTRLVLLGLFASLIAL
ncbi:hypothetical protein ANO14919_137060 [Xylariales sp. No.14919]|nr:hypothetical protein ANO14919_137060 [Xylariales sp. No.14919]